MIASPLAHLTHLLFQAVQGVVKGSAHSRSGPDCHDLMAACFAGDAHLVLGVSVVTGRVAGNPDIDEVMMSLCGKRVESLLDLSLL